MGIEPSGVSARDGHGWGGAVPATAQTLSAQVSPDSPFLVSRRGTYTTGTHGRPSHSSTRPR